MTIRAFQVKFDNSFLFWFSHSLRWKGNSRDLTILFYLSSHTTTTHTHKFLCTAWIMRRNSFWKLIILGKVLEVLSFVWWLWLTVLYYISMTLLYIWTLWQEHSLCFHYIKIALWEDKCLPDCGNTFTMYVHTISCCTV